VTTTDTRREAASRIQAALRDQIATHRANRGLSDEGKQRMIAAAHAAAERHLQTLRQAEADEHTRNRAQLERRLFGTPAGVSVTDYRDAQSRADMLDNPDQARALLARARRNGDLGLERALLARGFEAGWVDVVDDYVDARPHEVEAIDALISLNVAEVNAKSPGGRLANSATYGAAIPPELANTNEISCRALAAEAATVVETAPAPEFANAGGLPPGNNLRLATAGAFDGALVADNGSGGAWSPFSA
jgi:hypothetical protein